jgi:basic membrane lipoprotein Med (substrate-binding protein (PBP1-ABC) superfamily)
MVGRYPIGEVNRLFHAFMAGAKSINPAVEFKVSFIGSWYDPPKAKKFAYAQVESGADILYAERAGVVDAAREKGILDEPTAVLNPQESDKLFETIAQLVKEGLSVIFITHKMREVMAACHLHHGH